MHSLLGELVPGEVVRATPFTAGNVTVVALGRIHLKKASGLERHFTIVSVSQRTQRVRASSASGDVAAECNPKPSIVTQSPLTGPHGNLGTKYVWPVGFKSRRPYMSVKVLAGNAQALQNWACAGQQSIACVVYTLTRWIGRHLIHRCLLSRLAQDPTKRVWYESEIKEKEGRKTLVVTVRALDGSGMQFEGDNPTQAWHKVNADQKSAPPPHEPRVTSHDTLLIVADEGKRLLNGLCTNCIETHHMRRLIQRITRCARRRF